MARYRVDTLSQVARNGYWVAVICRCGNRRTFDPVALSLQYKVRMMDELMKRGRCKLCRQRPWDVQPCFKPETR